MFVVPSLFLCVRFIRRRRFSLCLSLSLSGAGDYNMALGPPNGVPDVIA